MVRRRVHASICLVRGQSAAHHVRLVQTPPELFKPLPVVHWKPLGQSLVESQKKSHRAELPEPVV